MAARAGAILADMEFVQFHPTAIDVGKDPAPLATEALRGHGAHLISTAGERFMLDIHPDAELAPRDVVARGIFSRSRRATVPFWIAGRPWGRPSPRSSTVYASCMEAGIDPVTQPIPVVPAAHYFMGGILTDANGRSSLDGLWACGEVTSTGAHGANRLASNSLLEAVVFAARIAEDIQGLLPAPRLQEWSASSLSLDEERPLEDSAPMKKLRSIMSAEFGVVRTGEGMLDGLRAIVELEQGNHYQRFENSLVSAKMIAVSAIIRHESRGGHYRLDYPEASPELAHREFPHPRAGQCARGRNCSPRRGRSAHERLSAPGAADRGRGEGGAERGPWPQRRYHQRSHHSGQRHRNCGAGLQGDRRSGRHGAGAGSLRRHGRHDRIRNAGAGRGANVCPASMSPA